MIQLPIDNSISHVVARLRRHRSLVLIAEPGAGKTTRVPPALLRAGLFSREHPNLVMLQPRRVAARAAAQRIADENSWELGGEVGYHVRFDKKLGPQTRLRVLTEGILTRQLLDDPFLEGVGAVLLDEFHERSLHTDVTIALLREVRQTVREDLILVVMSATLEAEPVARFLGDCPVVRIEGRTFPIEITYSAPSQAFSEDRVFDAVSVAISGAPFGTPFSGLPQGAIPTIPLAAGGAGPGDVLVFLPGAEEIRRAGRRLEALAQRENLLVLPLHGSLPPEEQARALRPARQRKVILATNIAETSLTIDGVNTVIDSGLARVAGYDPRRGLDRLELKRISKASATQRAGRAGRTGPGRCLRLWTAREEQAMADYELPEVRRVDLCGTVLSLHAWGKPDPRAFGWYEPPPEQTLVAAERLLAMLGALDREANGAITPLGRSLMELPVHPRLARLLLAGAHEGRLEEAAALAALLSEKDLACGGPPSVPGGGRPMAQGSSDLLVRLEMLQEAERDRFSPALRDRGIDAAAARQVAKARDDLLRIARRLSDRPGRARHAGDDETLLKAALLAYPDRVCRRRAADPMTGTMVGGGGVRLSPDSVVRQPEFFLALDARQDERSARREAFIRVASAVRVEWLEELFPETIRKDRTVVYDAQRERVVGLLTVSYHDLILREDPNAAVDPSLAAKALADALRTRAHEIFAADEDAGTLLARVALLRKSMPENPWPAFNTEELGDVLAEACHGRRSLDDVRRAPLAAFLKNRLLYPLDRLLEEHAPETVAVPSGNRIRLTYAPGQAPVLAVRLQELFGWSDTPRLAGGRVPLVLHLLGPNYRPVQITDDLRGFWSGTYFQVRKDLRARYPKHSWPEDPLSAKPEARGGRGRR